MSFLLKGIFTKSTNDNIISLARSKWHKLRIKKFEGELVGIGIVAPDLTYRAIDDDYEECEEINNKIENELQDFSKIFPETTFAYVFVDCFGGYCQYTGFVCKNGEKIVDYSNAIGEIQPNEEQTKVLKKILEEVGFSVEENGYFEPFTRGYFTE